MLEVFWIASFVLVVMDWRSGRPVLGAGLRTTSNSVKPRDPPFRRPTHDDAESVFSRDPSRHRRHDDDDDDEDEDIQSPFADPRGYAPTAGGQGAGGGRASMDMYGAFSDPAPSGYAQPGHVRQAASPPPATSSYYPPPTSTASPPPNRFQPPTASPARSPPPNMSRTMALAYEDTGTTSATYEDPYDRVRASLTSPRPGGANAPPSYEYRLS